MTPLQAQAKWHELKDELEEILERRNRGIEDRVIEASKMLLEANKILVKTQEMLHKIDKILTNKIYCLAQTISIYVFELIIFGFLIYSACQ